MTEESAEIDKQKEKMDEIIQDLILRRHYTSAIFWLDKFLVFSPQSEAHLLLYLEALYYTNQHFRALSFISSHKLKSKNFRIQLMCAHCYYQAQKYNEASVLLSGDLADKTDNSEVFCEFYLLKGKVAEAKDEKELAIQCYEHALNADLRCHEAVERLLDLVGDHSLEQHIGTNRGDPIKDIYSILYSKNCKVNSTDAFSCQIYENSVDGMVCMVQRLFDQFMFIDAYNLSKRVLERDFYNAKHLPYYIALLYKLYKEIELYTFTHKVTHSNNEITWYSIGMYYLLRNNTEMARKYFRRIINQNPSYVYAWMCLGHTYSMECEHDQAISVYLSAVNNSKSHKRALVSVATQYFNLDNLSMATNLLKEAIFHLPDDPLVIYELAVAEYKRERYSEALEGFNSVKSMCERRGIDLMNVFWEPLFNNIGFCNRKLGLFDLSIENHIISLSIKPTSSTYAVIAFNYCLKKMYFEAIEYLHKALSLSRDDVVANRILIFCIEMNFMVSDSLFMGMADPFDGEMIVEPLSDKPVDGFTNESGNVASADDINLSVTSPVVVMDDYSP